MIAVRAAAPADAEAWLRMRGELWPGDDADHAREVEAFFGGRLQNPMQVLLAFDASGRAVGFAELSIRNYAEGCVSDRVGYLEGWFVAGGARRKGVGRALVAAAEAWARSQGCTEFASDAESDNLLSAAAHKALGFVEAAHIRCYRKSLLESR